MSKIDPIFGLIQDHRVAYAKYLAAIDAGGKIPASLSDREGDLMESLRSTEPTTTEGCVALLEYVVRGYDSQKPILREDSHWRDLSFSILRSLRNPA